MHLATPFWYNAILAVLKPLYRQRLKKRSGHLADFAEELTERFGPFQPPKNQNVLWFHAVSVGETNAAQPLIEHYLQAGQAVLVTNTTRTGQARAKSLFLKKYPGLFQAVFLPVDQKDLIDQFLELYQPRVLALMETELWPNLLERVQLQEIPMLLLNARLSKKSAQGYARFKRLTAPMLEQLDFIAAQDQASLQRFAALGKSPRQMSVVGNIKFDIQPPSKFIQQAEQLRHDWQLESRQVITLASTHAPEEQKLLQMLQPYLKRHLEQLCIVVPRHPERFDEVFTLIQSMNLRVQRRSKGERIQADTQVYLADSMGELWLWYALSQACIVGGSFNTPGGGHNILEPMSLQVATVIGPNYFNFQSIADEFLQEQGLIVAEDEVSAIEQIQHLLWDTAFRQTQVEQATAVLSRNQGALQRHICLLDQYL